MDTRAELGNAPRQRQNWTGWGLLLLAVIAAIGWGAYLLETRAPLYGNSGGVIDRDSELPPGAQPAAPAQGSGGQPANPPATSDSAPAARQPDVNPASRASGRPDATAAARTPVAPSRDAARTDASAAAARTGATAPAEDAVRASAAGAPLSGRWSLATQIASTSVERFAGLRLGYELELQQEGNRVSGSGRKVSENGTPIAGNGQTPITVEGTVDGNRLQLNFVERGARRSSAGQFDLAVDGSVMRGRFTSDAARSGGTVEARRSGR